MNEAFTKPRLASLLDHFSVIEDPREQWRVAHPLPEVLLLVVGATIASCDDVDDVAAWGEAHLDFVRRFVPFYHGVPGGRWLNIRSRRNGPARRGAPIGGSRIPSTGSSTSPSRKTCRASEKAMAPRTWPSSGTSPSTSCETPRTSAPSNSDGKSPDGIPTTSTPC